MSTGNILLDNYNLDDYSKDLIKLNYCIFIYNI